MSLIITSLELLFSRISWEVHWHSNNACQKRNRTKVIAHYSCPFICKRFHPPRPCACDRWFTDQQTKTISQKYKQWRGETQTGQIHHSSDGDAFVKWVARRRSWGSICSDWPPTELRGKGGNIGVEWRRKTRGNEQGSVKERGWMDLLTGVFSYENKSIVTDGTLETS